MDRDLIFDIIANKAGAGYFDVWDVNTDEQIARCATVKEAVKAIEKALKAMAKQRESDERARILAHNAQVMELGSM